jgi:hypothetical protein
MMVIPPVRRRCRTRFDERRALFSRPSVHDPSLLDCSSIFPTLCVGSGLPPREDTRRRWPLSMEPLLGPPAPSGVRSVWAAERRTGPTCPALSSRARRSPGKYREP